MYWQSSAAFIFMLGGKEFVISLGDSRTILENDDDGN
jgi:hypothetical protein